MLVLLYNTLNAYRVTWFWQQVNTKLVNNPLTMQLSLAIMDALFWREREGNGTEDDLILAQWGGGSRERKRDAFFVPFFFHVYLLLIKVLVGGPFVPTVHSLAL